MASPIGFLLSGIEPRSDRRWNLADFRRAYWHEARRVGLEVKRASLARGLDKDGNRLAPIHALTEIARRDDVNPYTGDRPYSTRGRARVKFPPLMATGPRSRTIGLLTGEIRRDGVWFFWKVDRDTGRDWGEILARHAAGFSAKFRYPSEGWGYVKPRNVIGLSPADVRTIKQRMDTWVERNKARWPLPEAPPRTKPTPPPPLPVLPNDRRRYFGEGMADVTGLVGTATRLPNRELFGFAQGGGKLRFGGPKGPKPTPPPPKPPTLPSHRPTPPKPIRPDVRMPIPAFLLERLPVNIRARTLGDLFRNPFGWAWWLTVGLALWLAWAVERSVAEYEEVESK